MISGIFRNREGQGSAPGLSTLQIGKYEIIRQTLVSKPARVRVFLAFDGNLQRPVMIKAVAEGNDSRLAEQFQRDVTAIAKIRAPNVIAVYELGEHEGLPFAAMQHTGDDNLEAAIRTKRGIPLLQKALLLEQVASGVAEAHRGGLAYVGLQPGGIALTGDGGAIVQDFGVARLSSAQQTGNGIYAAPEDGSGGFIADGLSDVFGFGVICYEFLTGSHPFRESDSPACDWALEPAPLRQLLPDCPEALERMVAQSMAIGREQRHRSFAEIQEELRPIVRTLKRNRAAELWADGRRLIHTEKLEEAQGVVREALQLDPEDPDGQQVSKDLRILVQRQKIRKQIEHLWREADEMAAHRRFFAAVDLLEAAVRLDATELETERRLNKMRTRLGASVEAARWSSEARILQEKGELEEARAKAAKALERDPEDHEARELLHSIRELAERRERDARHEEGIGKAKALALEGLFEEAVAVLTALQADDSDSPLLQQWIDQIENQKSTAEKQQRLQAITSEAEFLLSGKRYGEAIAVVEAAVVEFPGNTALAELRERARREEERAAVIDRETARCDQLCREWRFDLAREAVERALSVLPGEPALRDLQQRVDAQERTHQRAARVREALRQADWLVEQDRPDLAARFLKEWLGGALDEPQLAERLKDLEKKLPEWEQRRFLDVLEEFAVGRGPSVLLPVLEEALKAGAPGAGVAEAAEGLRRRLHEEATLAEARRYLAAGDPDLAERALQRGREFLRDAPKSLEQEIDAYRKDAGERRAAQILVGQRRLAEADQALRRLASRDCPEIQELLDLVRAIRAANDETAFRQRVKGTAILLARQSKVEEAEDVARRLAALYPGDSALEEVRSIGRANSGRGAEKVGSSAEAATPLQPEPAPKVFLPTPQAGRDRRAVSKAAVLAGVLTVAAAGAGLWEYSSKPVEKAANKPALIQENPRSIAKPRQAAPPSEARVTAESSSLEQSDQEHIASVRTAKAAIARKPIAVPAPVTRRAFRAPASRLVAERGQRLDLPAPPAPSEGAAHEEPGALAIGQGLPSTAPPAPKALPAEQSTRAIRGSVVQPARLISAPAPRFPMLAAHNRVSGSVGIDAVVDKQGHVKQVSAVRGNPLLTEAAKQAVLKWRYEPATIDGEPVESQVTITVRFAGAEK
jgi:TonB family protein